MNTTARLISRQYPAPNRASSPSASGERSGRAVAGVSGSRTKATRMATATNAGITATQNTVWKWLAVSHISRMASNGPRKAPTVSSA
ncbi:hypothetical protein D3C78_1715890 [compost metagenome]